MYFSDFSDHLETQAGVIWDGHLTKRPLLVQRGWGVGSEQPGALMAPSSRSPRGRKRGEQGVGDRPGDRPGLPTAPPSLGPRALGVGELGELGEVRGDEGPLGASALEPSPHWKCNMSN